MNQLFTTVLVWALFSVLSTQSLGQYTPNLQFQCGTADMTQQQLHEKVRQGKLALERKRSSRIAVNSITYIPIRPHIFRQSDGTGGFSLGGLNQAMAIANGHFLANGSGMQFYFAGTTPDYIDNTAAYQSYNFESVDDRDVTNALNQYYVKEFETQLGGVAYPPQNGITSTRSFIATVAPVEYIGSNLIAHELGHTFNLIHTFGNTNVNAHTTELVTRGMGANCATDGDLICDTPADPFNIQGTSLIYPDNKCPQYNPASTARDANGDAYTPSVTNIMSYYHNSCTQDFTAGQYERMQEGLALRQSHTAYTLNASPTSAPAPTNLQASLNGSSVVLTWQDNADNEMGYFIERSTSPTTGFVSVGGVGPNITVFTESKTLPAGRYYYRVHPSNTTTGSISTIVDITVSGDLKTSITENFATLEWPSAGTGATYEIQWRKVGSSTWTTILNFPENRMGLPNLAGNTAYEWQVRTTGSDQYAGPVSFTVPCLAPISYFSKPAGRSALIGWQVTSSGDVNVGQTYNLRWRAVGSPNWMIVNTGTNSYSLTNLQPGTTYEWQVQSICSPTVNTDFTLIQSFSTLSCQTPSSLQVYNIISSSASLSWTLNYTENGRTTELRYRPVGGGTEWIMISSLTGTSYSLSGLASNTQYEWQARSICSTVESSDFSGSAFFQTKPPCESMYTLKSGSWPDPSIWSCGWVPIATDIVHLRHSVTISSGIQVTIRQLIYDAPVSLKLLNRSSLLLSK